MHATTLRRAIDRSSSSGTQPNPAGLVDAPSPISQLRTANRLVLVLALESGGEHNIAERTREELQHTLLHSARDSDTAHI